MSVNLWGIAIDHLQSSSHMSATREPVYSPFEMTQLLLNLEQRRAERGGKNEMKKELWLYLIHQSCANKAVCTASDDSPYIDSEVSNQETALVEEDSYFLFKCVIY